jgi:3-methylcrotonyl-CoA carboxylase alpha subunit
MFTKILIANRGEIAVRVMQACAEMGIRTVAVYSDADARALHVRRADERYHIGLAPATASYLDVERIVAAARASRAEAIHPGYGFLSENPRLAEACRQARIVFIGPGPEAMRLLGSKRAAKALARQAGVPVVPGYDGEAQEKETLTAEAHRIGFPLLIKASAGGGGRGMRLVRQAPEFPEALEAAQREARSAFGDGTVLLERLIEPARHVEFQVVADSYGNVVHLGERECSVQRRHQKVIEESPSTALTPALRAEMGTAAVALMRAAGYVNTGTVEFILAPSGEYFFLEVNTRLQVEHPVTEALTGVDLVREQIRIAASLPLEFQQADVRLRGHAIECRIYAEDAAQGFRPSTGELLLFEPPVGPGMRNDVGVATGDVVTPYYDSMLAKLIVAAPDREACIARTAVALGSYAVLGLTTNVPLLQRIVDAPAFRQGKISTGYLDQHLPELLAETELPEQVLLAAAAWEATARRQANPSGPGARERNPWRARMPGAATGMVAGNELALRFVLPADGMPAPQATSEKERAVTIGVRPGEARDTWSVNLPGGRREIEAERTGSAEVWIGAGAETWRAWVVDTEDAIHVSLAGQAYTLRKRRGPDVDDLEASGSTGQAQGTLAAPLPGVVAKLHVHEGDAVQEGQTLVVVEAMKTEIAITAPYSGRVKRLRYGEGDLVQAGEMMVELTAATDGAVVAGENAG